MITEIAKGKFKGFFSNLLRKHGYSNIIIPTLVKQAQKQLENPEFEGKFHECMDKLEKMYKAHFDKELMEITLLLYFKMPSKTATGLYSVQHWLGFKGSKNCEGKELTKDMIINWFNNQNKEVECVFCGNTYPFGIWACIRCEEYKGIQPYIPEWSSDK